MTGLLHRLSFGIWAMLPERATAYYGVVSALLKGQAVPAAGKSILAAQVMGMDDGELPEDELVVEAQQLQGNVMVITVEDVILKRGEECSYGMDNVADMLEAAEKDDTIVGGVLKLDTPGGEANGMLLLADALARTKKPWLAYVHHGMACSAGYGIAASCREVYLSSPQDMLGSVGAVVTLVDMDAYLRKEGIPVHEVYATASTDKNGAVREALQAPGDGKDSKYYARLRAERIDPFNNAFIQLVKDKRPMAANTADQWSTGSTFFGDEAINLGLADGYNTLQGVVQRVRELASTTNATTATATSTAAAPRLAPGQPQNTSTMKFRDIFTKAIGLFTLTEQQPTPSAEQLAQANAELKETGLQLVDLKQLELLAALPETLEQLEAVRAELADAEAKLTGANAQATSQADTLRATLTELGVEVGTTQDPHTVATATLKDWADRTSATHTAATKSGDQKAELSPSLKAAQEAGIVITEN